MKFLIPTPKAKTANIHADINSIFQMFAGSTSFTFNELTSQSFFQPPWDEIQSITPSSTKKSPLNSMSSETNSLWPCFMQSIAKAVRWKQKGLSQSQCSNRTTIRCSGPHELMTRLMLTRSLTPIPEGFVNAVVYIVYVSYFQWTTSAKANIRFGAQPKSLNIHYLQSHNVNISPS